MKELTRISQIFRTGRHYQPQRTAQIHSSLAGSLFIHFLLLHFSIPLHFQFPLLSPSPFSSLYLRRKTTMPPPKRLPIKRTASQKEILFDVAEPPPIENPNSAFDHRLLSMLSPRNNRRHSDEFPWSSQHLRACGLCRRRLVPGRDIYMYKGESAFCSAECRQQQMNQDEAKEKYKKGPGAVTSTPAAVAKVSAINGETVAAV